MFPDFFSREHNVPIKKPTPLITPVGEYRKKQKTSNIFALCVIKEELFFSQRLDSGKGN